MSAAIQEKVIMLVDEVYRTMVGDALDVTLKPSTDIQKDLGFDSIVVVVLLIKLEDFFHIRFDALSTDLGTVFTTIQSISEYIGQHMEQMNDEL